jgi:hypothetical protein
MNSSFNNALTQETPGKVFSLLGAAMFSMAFLLAVSVSNAGFGGTEQQLPNPFSAQNVVASIDGAANSYSNFLTANLFQPLAVQMDLLKDNAGFIADNSGLTYALGLSEPEQGQVAGASIKKVGGYAPEKSSGVFEGLYHALIQ